LVEKDAIVSFHSVAQQGCSHSYRSGMVCGTALNQTKKQLAAARLLRLGQCHATEELGSRAILPMLER